SQELAELRVRRESDGETIRRERLETARACWGRLASGGACDRRRSRPRHRHRRSRTSAVHYALVLGSASLGAGTSHVGSGPAPRRQSTYRVFHVRPRKPRRKKLVHLPRALLAAQVEELPSVLRVQVRLERTQCRKVQFASGYKRESPRKSSAQSRCRD